MKPYKTALLAFTLLASPCLLANENGPFVQGNLRLIPPIQSIRPVDILPDGGTRYYTIKDATGKAVDVYIDYRLGTKTRGSIYLFANPESPASVKIQNEADFKKKVTLE